MYRRLFSINMEQTEAGKQIWTIGHSTRTGDDFLETLKSFNIEVLADVRRYPGSRKYPQFNAFELEPVLARENVDYVPMPELGGRRKAHPDSKNTVWRNEAFRGYADYTASSEFEAAIAKLTDLARRKRLAYMCSEAVWWRCHRSIISDYLKERGWLVMHIMNKNVATEHPYTSAYLQLHPDPGKSA
jgi:uncharacterized protein (DUF488 family)